MKPRARRIADIVASVPLDTMRTLLAGRHPRADLLGQQHLALGRRAVGRAVAGGVAHRLDDLRVGVAGDDRAVGLHEVEEAMTFDIPHVGPSARATKYGVPPTAPNARTGEFTPPGMTSQARANSSSLVCRRPLVVTGGRTRCPRGPA